MKTNILIFIVAVILILAVVSICRRLFKRMNKILYEIRKNNEYQNFYYSIVRKQDEQPISASMIEIKRTQPDGSTDNISLHMDINHVMMYRVGDVFVLNRKDIKKSTFYRSLDKMHSDNITLLQDDYTFGKNRNKCSLQIVGRIFYDGLLIIQAKLVPGEIEFEGVNNI